MKKFITIGAAMLLSLGAFGQSFSVSKTIVGNTITNILSGASLVTDVQLTAPTAGAVTVQAIDNVTNSLRMINPAYTNRLTYPTNLLDIYTNYYGVITTNAFTNVLYVVTNNPVAAATNTIAPTFTIGASGNSSASYADVNYRFNYGLWVTNTSPSNATITITYQK